MPAITTKPADFLTVTAGGEFRSWTADHPGHFTNLYGKTSVNFSYARRDTDRQGHERRPSRAACTRETSTVRASDIGNIFGWTMAGANDAAYRTQYRNYQGETPQYTIFLQGNAAFGKVNFMGSIQYVWYKYKLTEYMPSENAIGRMLTRAEETSRGALTEGPTGNGKFLMKDNAASNPRWYEFDLVNETRSRGFLQPKVGVNVNLTDNLNVFGNFAHVERFVDLGVYYNQGRVAPERRR